MAYGLLPIAFAHCLLRVAYCLASAGTIGTWWRGGRPAPLGSWGGTEADDTRGGWVWGSYIPVSLSLALFPSLSPSLSLCI